MIQLHNNLASVENKASNVSTVLTVSSGKYETQSGKMDVEKVGRVEGICSRWIPSMYVKLIRTVLTKLTELMEFGEGS